MPASAYKHLLSPGKIGKLALRNRICVTAMGVSLAEDDGVCGDRLIAFHEEQARGGAGLIITGAAGVAWPVGGVQRNQVAISDDRFILGLRRLADTVHRHGARIAAQLHHGGLNATYAAAAGHPLWAPSVPDPPKGDFAHAFLPEEVMGAAGAGGALPSIKVVTRGDMQLLARQFAEAAVRAKAAGLDGVEIHGGHGYILSSFLSPSTNKRSDEYGGTLENRARLMLDVLRAVRASVGPNYPMWCKLDYREVGKANGITLEDAQKVAPMLEEAGADAITVTAYHHTGQGRLHSDSFLPHIPEYNVPGAAAIKRTVNIPILASGRIEPSAGDALIKDGSFDFLSMGRLLLADPQLPNKLAQGRADEIRPCIYCYTCVSAIYVCDSVRCAVNPETAFEYLASPMPKPTWARRIAVVGGGPAGMEAALRLSAGGHEVVLLERLDRLGGTLRFASLAYAPNERLLNWLTREIEKSAVEVRVRTAATPDLLRTLKPDQVIVARGAVRDMPPIPGSDLPHVFSGDDIRAMMLGEVTSSIRRKTGFVTRLATKIGAASGLTGDPEFVRKATHQWMPLGDRIVIIGGELVGLELAEFLAERRRHVTVIEDTSDFGRGLAVVRRARLIAELRDHGVDLRAQARDIRITPQAVTFTSAGDAVEVPADHVIVAKGARGDSTLADQFRAAGFTVREIGDGTGVAYIEGAIRSAAREAGALIEELSGGPRVVEPVR